MVMERLDRGHAVSNQLPIPSARFESAPSGPLASYPSFCAAIASRLAQGAKEYGDASFELPPSALLEEIEDELLDVAGWAYILWVRVHALRTRAQEVGL